MGCALVTVDRVSMEYLCVVSASRAYYCQHSRWPSSVADLHDTGRCDQGDHPIELRDDDLNSVQFVPQPTGSLMITAPRISGAQIYPPYQIVVVPSCRPDA